jgi:hypothetical protein
MFSRGLSLRVTRPGRIFASVLAVSLVASSIAFSQAYYRTFNQADLSLKKAHAGKVTGSTVTFTFRNPRIVPVQGFHAIISKKIIGIIDSGGFTNFKIKNKRSVDATGRDIAAGDSVTLTFLVNNRQSGTTINYFWWTDASGSRRTSTEYKISPILDEQHYVQPNGGNLRDFLYKKVLRRPEGLVLGIVAPEQGVGWIRNLTSNGKYFSHTGTPRCLDYTMSSSGRLKPITKQIRNLRVKKHDNHLLGELHAMKLAIIANDAGITEPTDPNENRLGDLIYDDGNGIANPLNGMMIREIVARGDSALTFCGGFTTEMIKGLDSTITLLNRQFDGPYTALSFDPFVLSGSSGLGEAVYLHTNPNPPPAVNTFRTDDLSILDDVPSTYALTQNYPNPFNPTTTIEFSLAEPGLVTLKVYDMIGREVATLLDNEEFDDGEALVNFDADELTSGVYFYRLTARGTGDQKGFFDELRKMVLMK